LPVQRSWRLNERHCDALAGHDRNDTIALYGPEQVVTWRRSFTVRPPLDGEAPAQLGVDPRYADVATEDLPSGESLRDVQVRLLTYFTAVIAPQLVSGQTVLVAAHGNSLRALVKHLEHIDDDDVALLEIPTGQPRAYLLDDQMRVLDHRVITL
jgi:2,3-bisphosphoglycerate-dependent phosphoglycerate mutase